MHTQTVGRLSIISLSTISVVVQPIRPHQHVNTSPSSTSYCPQLNPAALPRTAASATSVPGIVLSDGLWVCVAAYMYVE